MRVLIDLQHPTHLHFFRRLADRLMSEGAEVRFTGRDKDILVALAESLGVEVEIFGKARNGPWNLGRELLYRERRLYRIVREFRPDVMLAIAGTYVSLVGWLRGIPTYVFYDTEHATLSNMLAYPFCTCVYVPRCYRKPIRWRHVRYNGYQELAYLHPRYFTPDPSVLEEVGIEPEELFSIVRFVGWGAAHDIGLHGLRPQSKIKAVHELSKRGRVLISSEGPLPPELEQYRLRIDVGRIHHLMAHAALVFGESATMCSEGAVLGVPGVYVDPIGRGYTDEQERLYGLVTNFTPARHEEATAKGASILRDYSRQDWRAKGRQLVADKIDVTEMLYRIVMERPYA